MGTENDLDVEGQTEPPIRGLKSSKNTSASASSPTLAGTVRTAGTVSADSTPTLPGFTPELAHTLTVPDVSSLLETDSQYV